MKNAGTGKTTAKFMVNGCYQDKETGEGMIIASRIIEGISKKTGKPYSFLSDKSDYFKGSPFPIGTRIEVAFEVVGPASDFDDVPF